MPASVRIVLNGKPAFYRANWVQKNPPQLNSELKSDLRTVPGVTRVSSNHGEPRLEVASSSEDLEPIVKCFQKYGYLLTPGR